MANRLTTYVVTCQRLGIRESVKARNIAQALVKVARKYGVRTVDLSQRKVRVEVCTNEQK